MNAHKIDTKERIINAAAQQFAEKGFQGTSIRDIAAAAAVNLSAVNYHFTNKQTLFWETFVRAHRWMDESIAELQSYANTPELAWAIFQHLSQHFEYIGNTFKVMLASDAPAPEGDHLAFCQEKKAGPPGAGVVAAAIQKDLGQVVPVERLNWAVRNIFTHILHWVLLINAPYLKHATATKNLVGEENLRKSLILHVKATLLMLNEDEDFPAA